MSEFTTKNHQLRIKWTGNVVPAVVQDEETGVVLLLAWLNRDSIIRTLITGIANFFSRHKNKNWTKGITSGHLHFIRNVYWDCDYDALLLFVRSTGESCHNLKFSCFYNKLKNDYSIITNSILQSVVIAHGVESYALSLIHKSISFIMKKIFEELSEVTIAAFNSDRFGIVKEVADLCFHLTLLLMSFSVEPIAVVVELKNRIALSGLVEKRSRCD